MPIQCMMCKHYLRDNKCKAFTTNQIPYEIMIGQIEHDLILPYQNGEWVFEEKKEFKKQNDANTQNK